MIQCNCMNPSALNVSEICRRLLTWDLYTRTANLMLINSQIIAIINFFNFTSVCMFTENINLVRVLAYTAHWGLFSALMRYISWRFTYLLTYLLYFADSRRSLNASINPSIHPCLFAPRNKSHNASKTEKPDRKVNEWRSHVINNYSNRVTRLVGLLLFYTSRAQVSFCHNAV